MCFVSSSETTLLFFIHFTRTNGIKLKNMRLSEVMRQLLILYCEECSCDKTNDPLLVLRHALEIKETTLFVFVSSAVYA